MTDRKHTPGPWQAYADLPSTEPNWHIVTNESRMRVVANVHIEPGNAVDEANARLIVAAPDLLASLSACVGYLLNAKIDLETGASKATAIRTIEGGIKQARDALAKLETT